jgi:hypothetical protein
MDKSLFLLLPVFLITACSRDEIETYQVPKEAPAAPAVQMQAQQPAIRSASTAEASPSVLPFTAETSAAWTVKPGSGMRIVSYSIEGTSIDFYLISLSMGDVPSNVNRWRGQIGLSPATPEQIASELQTFQADGHDVNYIELYNPDSGKGIIAAIMDLAPSYWYFTAKGSVEELKANAGDIKEFLKSLQLNP